MTELTDAYSAPKEESFRDTEVRLGVVIPLDYVAFLERSNGGQFMGVGFLKPDTSDWIPVEQLEPLEGLATILPDSDVWPDEYAPAIRIGSGSDSEFGLSCSSKYPGAIFRLCVPHSEFEILAPSFANWYAKLANNPDASYWTNATKDPWRAAERGDISKIVKADGNAVDATDKRKTTLLHIAAANRRVELAKCLLDHRADIQRIDAFGWAAVHYAAHVGRSIDMLVLLIQRGDSLARTDSQGNTPLHLVAQYLGSFRVFRWLIDQGCDPTLPNFDGQTAASLVVDFAKENPTADSLWQPFIEFLIEKGYCKR